MNEHTQQSSPLDNLERQLLEVGGSGVTQKEIGSEQVLSKHLVEKLMSSLKRQEAIKDASQQTAVRSIVVPCIFKGEKSAVPSQGADPSLRATIDGIISFQSLLQQFHSTVFDAFAFAEATEKTSGIEADPAPIFLSSVAQGHNEDADSPRPKTPSSPTKMAPTGKKSYFLSMGCTYLKEHENKAIRLSASLRRPSVTHYDKPDIVVVEAFDCSENKTCRPLLNYNHPFLETAVLKAHRISDIKAKEHGSFVVPRWRCGTFTEVHSHFEAERMLSNALQVFHEKITEDATKYTDSLLVQYCVMHVQDSGRLNLQAQGENGRLFCTVVYFVLTATTGSFISGLQQYHPSTIHQTHHVATAPNVTPPQNALVVPSKTQQHAALVESMKQAMQMASASFWHPLLDEVIVYNVASLTAIGATEGSDGVVPKSTQDSLSVIQKVLTSEQHKIMRVQRTQLQDLWGPLETPGSHHEEKDGKGKRFHQPFALMSTPGQGLELKSVLARARVTVNLAKLIQPPYQWLREYITGKKVREEDDEDDQMAAQDSDEGSEDRGPLAAQIDAAALFLRDLHVKEDIEPRRQPPPTPSPSKPKERASSEEALTQTSEWIPVKLQTREIEVQTEHVDIKDDDAEEFVQYISTLKGELKELDRQLELERNQKEDLLEQMDKMEFQRAEAEAQYEAQASSLRSLRATIAALTNNQSGLADELSKLNKFRVDVSVGGEEEMLEWNRPPSPPTPPPAPIDIQPIIAESTHQGTEMEIVATVSSPSQTRFCPCVHALVQTEDWLPETAPILIEERATSPIDFPLEPAEQESIALTIGVQTDPMAVEEPKVSEEDVDKIRTELHRSLSGSFELHYANRVKEVEAQLQEQERLMGEEREQHRRSLEGARRRHRKELEAVEAELGKKEQEASEATTDKMNLLKTLRAVQEDREDTLSRQDSISALKEKEEDERHAKEKMRSIIRALQLELEKIKVQCTAQEQELYDCQTKNETLSKLLQMRDESTLSPNPHSPGSSSNVPVISNGSASQQYNHGMCGGHYAGHCTHPHSSGVQEAPLSVIPSQRVLAPTGVQPRTSTPKRLKSVGDSKSPSVEIRGPHVMNRINEYKKREGSTQ